MKEKYKKVHGQKNFKIQHVYLIFKYRTKIYTSIKVYQVKISHRNIKLQFMQMAIPLISFSNNIFPSQINSQTHKSIKVHAEQMSNPLPL
jgi:hypothetical protein